MAYEIQHLKPELIYFKEHELLPVTLDFDVWAIRKYGSLKEMLVLISKPTKETPLVLFEVLHKLIKDKTVYKNPDSIVKDFIGISKQKYINEVKEAYQAVKTSIDDSSPLIINPERHKTNLDMLRAKGEVAESCYGTYYDTIAKRYGYSINEFYGLTMRQLHIILGTISAESYKELELEAALQGRELKPRMNVENITPEQDKENEAQAEEAYASLMERFKNAKNSD